MFENSPKIYFTRYTNPITAGLEQEYLALLPYRMRLPILRYRRWQDRQASLFGKLLLLRALRLDFSHVWAEKISSLELTRYGKPFIPTGPEFNISHSGEIVVLAISRDGSIGIDLEKIRSVNLEDYTRDLPEVSGLPGTYDADRTSAFFFNCWTRKEAVLKGCGKGLSVDLKQVGLQDGTAVFRGKIWYTGKLDICEGYCCHLATDKPLYEVTIEEIDLINEVSHIVNTYSPYFMSTFSPPH